MAAENFAVLSTLDDCQKCCHDTVFGCDCPALGVITRLGVILQALGLGNLKSVSAFNAVQSW